MSKPNRKAVGLSSSEAKEFDRYTQTSSFDWFRWDSIDAELLEGVEITTLYNGKLKHRLKRTQARSKPISLLVDRCSGVQGLEYFVDNSTHSLSSYDTYIVRAKTGMFSVVVDGKERKYEGNDILFMVDGGVVESNILAKKTTLQIFLGGLAGFVGGNLMVQFPELAEPLNYFASFGSGLITGSICGAMMYYGTKWINEMYCAEKKSGLLMGYLSEVSTPKS